MRSTGSPALGPPWARLAGQLGSDLVEGGQLSHQVLDVSQLRRHVLQPREVAAPSVTALGRGRRGRGGRRCGLVPGGRFQVVSSTCSKQAVPGGSKWFQVVPGDSTW